jgi:hypothetical protein
VHLGISSYSYTWSIGVPGRLPDQPMTLNGLLERAQALTRPESGGLKVKVLQVADNLPLDRLSADELDEFDSRARQGGIQVEVGTRGIAPGHLRRYLDLAVRFHSPMVRVVIDTPAHHPSPGSRACAV